jgi:hypothetical protein
MNYNTSRKSRAVYGNHFYGNEASDYGKEQGYVDYRTFSKAFDAVMNNSIMQDLESAGYYFEPVQDGSSDYSDEIDELREEADELRDKAQEANDEADELEDQAREEADAGNGEKSGELLSQARKRREEAEAAETEADKKEERADDLEAEQDPPEIFQFFIVDDAGAEIIQEWTDDPLFYCSALDMYIWGVTHWGTSWDYVLTDIRLNAGEEVFK